MGSGSMRCVFLLLGTSSLITCIFFYRRYGDVTPRSERPAGGGVGPGEEEEEQSIIVPAASGGGEEETEEEEEEEAACSLRRAVRNDPLLRTRFRFSEPVLQWSRSFSRPDWEQLKDREPPYGWGELPVHVVGSALSLLNSSRLFERRSPGRCVRCAVVGNGGILRGSGQGRSIDSHDLVFRMNGAVIRGFERDVGTKISFYGFTTNTMKNSLLRYRADGFTRIPQSPDIRYVFIPSDLRDYVMMAAAVQGRTVQSGADKGDRPWRFFGHRAADGFRMLHPRFISYLTHSFLQSPLLSRARTKQLYMPSTGALMLLTAVHTCDQVSAYGFITSDYASFSDHYYDSRTKPLRFYSNHDLRMERRLWEELDRRRVIRLFQRTGGG